MGTKKITAAEPTTYLDVKRNARGQWYLVEVAGNNERTLVGEGSPRRSKAKERALRVVERFRGHVVIRIRDRFDAVEEEVVLAAVKSDNAPRVVGPAKVKITVKR